MLVKHALMVLILLAGCSAQSEGPLFETGTALPLQDGARQVIDLVMPDGDGGPVLFTVMEDGHTLVLSAAEKEPGESDEDIAITFHPLSGAGDMMISQGQIVEGSAPKSDRHGYHILECPVGGQLRIFKFDLPSLEELGPFEGVDFNGLYAPEVRIAEGLMAFYRAASTLESFEPADFEPVIDCDKIFE